MRRVAQPIKSLLNAETASAYKWMKLFLIKITRMREIMSISKSRVTDSQADAIAAVVVIFTVVVTAVYWVAGA